MTPGTDLEAEAARHGVALGGPAAWRKLLLNVPLFGLPFAGTTYAIARVPTAPPGWAEWACLVGLYVVTGVGISLGFHRCFTHQSFRPAKPLRLALLFAGSLAGQGPVIRWVADHRRHHRFADRPWDAHSPYFVRGRPSLGRLRGLLHAHVGWIFDRTTTIYHVYAPDLLRDRTAVAFHRTFLPIVGISYLVPFLFGWAVGGPAVGWSCLLWGGCVRTTLVHQVTWCVNSLGHMFGGRQQSERDHSRNNAVLAAITFGDGWHNNHHAAPRVAYTRRRWYQLDINGLIIYALGRLGLATDIVTAAHADGRDE